MKTDIIAIKNEIIHVEWENAAHGPVLKYIEYNNTPTRDCFNFSNANEFQVVLLDESQKNDLHFKVIWKTQDNFQFEKANKISENKIEFLYKHSLVSIKIIYELPTGKNFLSKKIICKSVNKDVYVAGVRLWILKPDNELIIERIEKQPVVLLADSSGCFITLGMPGPYVSNEAGEIILEYRPGYKLTSEKERVISQGIIGLFSTNNNVLEKIEIARRSFCCYLTDVAKPQLPFPVKFTTWGPWLMWVNEKRIVETLDDIKYVGTDLLHLDAGWQTPYFPYSEKLYHMKDADDFLWDHTMIETTRLPNGLQNIRKEIEKRGMNLSFWFDTCGNVFIREEEKWAVQDENRKPSWKPSWENRWRNLPLQSLSSNYAKFFKEFIMQMVERYNAKGVLFDNQHFGIDHASGRSSMANGWNSTYVQCRILMEIFEEIRKKWPGIYLFSCGSNVPMTLLFATHIHAGDPGTSKNKALATDFSLRALAYERRLAWRCLYEDHFLPSWSIKGDIAGWSVQQGSYVPINSTDHDLVPGLGEGWTQNMFTCFATTVVWDIRFCFAQMPKFDRDILKEWLEWDRKTNSEFSLYSRPVIKTRAGMPDDGICCISQIYNGKGIIYIFNQSFQSLEAEIKLDEIAGFCIDDKDISATIIYPVKSPLSPDKVSYADIIKVPLIGKDCLVIEIGLNPVSHTHAYEDYVHLTNHVSRSFKPIYIEPEAELFNLVSRKNIVLETGSISIDRNLATLVLEPIKAAACKSVAGDSDSQPNARLVIGTYDGLYHHPEIGKYFIETLYNRYIKLKEKYYSAPIFFKLESSDIETYCVLGPRPEHLMQMATALNDTLINQCEVVCENVCQEKQDSFIVFDYNFSHGNHLLRFRPLVKTVVGFPVPNKLGKIRFKIDAIEDDKTTNLWSEDISPFLSSTRYRSSGWWNERVLDLSRFSGKKVSFRLYAGYLSGNSQPILQLGYDRIAVIRKTNNA